MKQAFVQHAWFQRLSRRLPQNAGYPTREMRLRVTQIDHSVSTIVCASGWDVWSVSLSATSSDVCLPWPSGFLVCCESGRSLAGLLVATLGVSLSLVNGSIIILSMKYFEA